MRKSALVALGSVAFAAAVVRAEVAVNDGVLTVDVASGVTRSLTDDELAAVRSGEVTEVKKTGSGNLSLETPLSDYTGSWRLSGRNNVKATGENALGVYGGGADFIYVDTSSYGARLVLNGTTVDKRIEVNGSSDYAIQSLNNMVNYLLRPVTVLKGNLAFVINAGTALYIDGGLSNTVGAITCNAAGGNIYVRNVPAVLKEVKISSTSIRFQCPSNQITTIRPYYGGGVFLECEDAVAGKRPEVIFTKLSGYTNGGYLHLCGLRHEFGNLSHEAGMTPGDPYMDGAAGSVFDFVQTKAATNTLVGISGSVKLVKRGEAEFAQDRVVSSKGDVEILEGRFAFLSSGTWMNAGTVTVGGTGLLAIARPDTFKNEVVVNLNGEARGEFEIAEGVLQKVGALYVNGVRQKGGYYGAPGTGATYEDTGRFAGRGRIFVVPQDGETTTATWQPGGANQELTEPSNWTDAPATLDFETSSLVPTFSATGVRAEVDRDVALKGVVFDATGMASNEFTLAAATGDEKVALGGLGVTAVAPANSLKSHYTINAPVMVANDQTWDVQANCTLYFRAPLSSEFDFLQVTKTGAGQVNLYAENPDFIGPLTITKGTVEVYARKNGLGTGDREVYLDEANGGKLYLRGGRSGVTVGRLLRIRAADNGSFSSWGTSGVTSVTNVLTGPMVVEGGNSLMYVQDAARFVTEGGVTITASRYGTQSNNSSGKWIVRCKPMTCAGNFDHAWVGLDLCVAGNAFKAFRFACETNARIDCYEDWALNDTNTTVTVTDLNKAADKRWKGYVDLHGHDQQIGTLQLIGTSAAYVTSSGAEGVLNFHQKAAFTNSTVKFTGKLGISKAGPKAFGIDMAMTASGGVAVREGRLDFTANGSWLDTTNVVVSGADAVLSIAHGATFTRPAVSIADGGRMELDNAVPQKARNLFLDGEPVRISGTYGSSASPAQFRDDRYFTGTGVLDVHSTYGGMLLIVR